MSVRISSTKAARNLGYCLARIERSRDTFVLTKNDKPVALLAPLPAPRTAPLRDVVQALRQLPPDPGFADALERVNASDRPLETDMDQAHGVGHADEFSSVPLGRAT